MPLATAYSLELTHDGSQFLLQPYSVNGPANPFTTTLYSDPNRSAVAANTSLILFGKGVPEYGEFLQQNMLNMLQNFANASAPTYPVTGQLWFDIGGNNLKIYDGASWLSIVTGSALALNDLTDVTTPAPSAGQYLTYNGAQWANTSLPSALQEISIASPNSNDTLVYQGGWVTRNSTQMRAILDVFSTAEANTIFINVAGDTMQGVLNMGGFKITNLLDPTDSQDAASKSYVDGLLLASPYAFSLQYNYNQELDNVTTVPQAFNALDKLVYNNQINSLKQYVFTGAVGGVNTWTFEDGIDTVTVNDTDNVEFPVPVYVGGHNDILVHIHPINDVNNSYDVTTPSSMLSRNVPSYIEVSLNPRTVGRQSAQFASIINGASTTSLSATTYSFVVYYNGIRSVIDIDGSVATTFGVLLSELNTALSGIAVVSYNGANIDFIAESSAHIADLRIGKYDEFGGNADLLTSLPDFEFLLRQGRSVPVDRFTSTGFNMISTYSLSVTYETGSESLTIPGAEAQTYGDLIEFINYNARGVRIKLEEGKLIFLRNNLVSDIATVTGTSVTSLTDYESTGTPVSRVTSNPITESNYVGERTQSVTISNQYFTDLEANGGLQIGTKISIMTLGVV